MGFVHKERLHQAMPQAYQRGISLEQFLVESGDLNPNQWGQVIQIRMRFGRKCGSCAQVTYLMGKIPPCEHCGGQLQLQPGDEQPGVRGESGSHRLPRQAVEAMRPKAPPQQQAPVAPPRPVAQRPAPPPRPTPPPNLPAAQPRAQAAPPPRPKPPPEPEPADLATRTMLDEPLEFDEMRDEPVTGGGKLLKPRGKKKPPSKTAAPKKSPGDDLPSGEDLLKDAEKAKAKAKPKGDGGGPPKSKESGHFQFKTFSFRRSQLGLDALAAEEALREAEQAAKKDDFADLAKQVASTPDPSSKAKSKASGPNHDASTAKPSFKVSGTTATAGGKRLSDANKKRLGGVLVVVALASCLIFAPFDKLFSSYEWQLERKVARDKAKSEKKLLIEYTTDPRLRQCILFREQVLENHKVESLREEFVWYKEIIDTQLMPETIRYDPPYVFIYDSDGKTVLAGSRTAGELSADGMLELLQEAKRKAK